MLLKVGIIKIHAVSLECFHEYTVHVPYRGDLLPISVWIAKVHLTI